jgi:VanZ family protein
MTEGGHKPSGTRPAKFAKLAKPAQMRAGLLRTSLRFLTWICVGFLGLLSLLPAEDMARTGFPSSLEHFAAYAGSGAVAMAGYGLDRGAVRVIGPLWVYAAILEFLQHFSPGRNPAVVDFAASAIGALCGGVAVVLLWRWRSAPLGPRGGA